MRKRSIFGGLAPHQSAQALIEFALILPVMLVMLLGGIDIGRALVYGVAVQDGAREATRLATTAAIDSSIVDSVVLQRLIDASKPALGGCQAIKTLQTCGGGTWTFGIAVVTPTRPVGNPWTLLNDGIGGGARSDAAFQGSQLTVTATGSVSMLTGFSTFGMSLFPITARGQAVMVVL